MEHLRELLAVDGRQALAFFVLSLQDVCESGVDRDELLYNACVLAHCAQTSTQTADELPTPVTLSDVFDHFVLDTTKARRSDDGNGGRAVPSARRVL